MLLTSKQLAFIDVLAQTIDDEHPRGNHLKAYIEVYKPGPHVPREQYQRRACMARKRIFDRADVSDILKGTGLGPDRFAFELDKRLKAEKDVNLGGEVTKVPDNGIRMAATSLLADVLGYRKRETAININQHNELRALIVEVRSDDKPDISKYPGIAEEFKRLIPGTQDRPEGSAGPVHEGSVEVPGDVRVDRVGEDDPGVPEGDNVQSPLPEELRDSPEKYPYGA